MSSRPDLARAVQALANAIEDEGVAPAHHRSIMHRSRVEWPVLWTAIDALLATSRAKPEGDLSSAIEKHGLTVTPSGSFNPHWVAYNHDHTGRGSTPDDAVADAVRKIEGRTA